MSDGIKWNNPQQLAIKWDIPGSSAPNQKAPTATSAAPVQSTGGIKWDIPASQSEAPKGIDWTHAKAEVTSTPEPVKLATAAVAPIADIPNQTRQALQGGIDEVKQGASDVTQPGVLPKVKGVAEMGLGALGAATSGITGPIHALVGQPTENITGSPTAGNIADTVAGLAIPGGGTAAGRELTAAAGEKALAGTDRLLGEVSKDPEVAAAQTAARGTADDLNRLRGENNADKVVWMHYLDALPPEVKTPALQEKLFHYGEAPGKVKLTPDEQAIWDKYVQPLKERETDVAKRLQQKGVDLKLLDENDPSQPNYMHRIRKDMGAIYDQRDPDAQTYDPIMGNRSLSKKASALQHRTTEGTVADIETNSDLRYHKNAVVNTVDNIAHLERVERNIDLLEKLKTDSVANGRAVKMEGNAPSPKGYRESTIPQLRNYAFDERTANVLDDFYQSAKAKGNLGMALENANRYLTGSLFFNPLPHIENVFNDWLVSRGFENFKQIPNLVQAWREVARQGPEYIANLREGAGLQYHSVANRNFVDTMVKAMGGELGEETPANNAIAKAWGYANPKALVQLLYKASSKAMWKVNDVLLQQRISELMKAGRSRTDAITEAHKHIASYRIPSEIMGSRLVSELMQNRNVQMFGGYRYGRLASLGHMVRDITKGTKQEKVDATGQMLTMALLLGVAYPLADKALQMITGNQNASANRPGVLGIPQSVGNVATGNADPVSLLSNIMNLPPATEMIPEALSNRNAFTGQHIVDPYHGINPGRNIPEAADYAAGKIAPVGQAMSVIGGSKSPGEIAGSQVGVKVPSDEELARRKAGIAGRFKGSRQTQAQQEDKRAKKMFAPYRALVGQ